MLHAARPADAPALLRLIRDYYAHDGLSFDPVVAQQGLALLLSRPEYGRVFLIRWGDQTVGYAILTYAFDLEFGGRQAFLTDLFVDEAHRGRGLGSRALAELERFAQSEGLAAIELQVEARNAPAQAFYRRQGYRAHPRVPMSKQL